MESINTCVAAFQLMEGAICSDCYEKIAAYRAHSAQSAIWQKHPREIRVKSKYSKSETNYHSTEGDHLGGGSSPLLV